MQKITLIGRLGRDVAVREARDGGKFLSFSVATNVYSRDVEKTHWFEVTAFNYDRYRKMVKYLTKGSSIIVTGDLDADLETGDDGKQYLRRRVVADSIEFNSNGTSGGTSETRTENESPRRSRRQEAEDISDEELEMSAKAKKRSVEPDEDDEPAPKKRKPVVDDEDDEPAPKKRKRTADDEDDEPAPKKRKAADVDEDDDEPAPKKRKPADADEDDGDDLPF